MVGTKGKIFEVLVSRLLENSFLTLFLPAEAYIAYFWSPAAAIFLGTLEFHGEFYEIEFYNSIQD